MFNQLNKKLYKAYISIDKTSDENFIDELVEDINNSYLYSKEYTAEELEIELSRSGNAITAIGFDLAYSIPSLRPITENCKKEENALSCLSLSEILIPSKTLIFQMIGSRLKIDSLKILNKDENLIKQAELQKQQFIDSRTCYSNTKDLTLATYLNSDFTENYFAELSTYGENIAWKNLALKVHKIQIDNGLVTDFDPNDCG